MSSYSGATIPSTSALPAVGIDVGANSCRMARIDDTGRSVMLRNSQGELATPSVVLFDDDEIVVGRDAQPGLSSDPDRAADEPNRDLGQARYWRLIRGRELPPEVVLACILRSLRDHLAATLGEYAQTVLSVPASFGEPGRKAICDAGYLAGLNVLEIISEPLAAALALGEQLGYLDGTHCPHPPINALVVDLGSAAFDVAVVELSAGCVRMLAGEGDSGLGGRDWSHRLRDYAADEFVRQYRFDPRRDLVAVANLNRAAEAAQHTLSTRHVATVHVECGGQSLDVTISRGLFEELTADLVERAAYCVRQLMLAAAWVSWRDLQEVLLVGGATRMPMISRKLRDLLGLEPRTSLNPEEAVARGAALYAGSLLAERDPAIGRPRFIVQEIANRSLGLEMTDATIGRKQQRTLIPRNSALPCQVVETFTTGVANTRAIAVRLLEGESPDAEHCSLAARAVIAGFPQRLPRGAPIEVTYARLASGRLAVGAVLLPRGEPLRVTLENDGSLNEPRIALWREALDQRGGFGPIGQLAAEISRSAAIAPSRPLAGQPASIGAARRSGATNPGSPGAMARLKPPEPEKRIVPRATAGQAEGDEIGIAPETVARPPAKPSYAPLGVDLPLPDPTAPDPFASDPLAPDALSYDPLSPETYYSPDPAANSPADAADWDPNAQASDRGAGGYTRTPRKPERSAQQQAASMLMNLAGHLTASLLGLGLGYYVLCRMSPESNFLHLSLPGVQDVKPDDAQKAGAAQPPQDIHRPPTKP